MVKFQTHMNASVIICVAPGTCGEVHCFVGTGTFHLPEYRAQTGVLRQKYMHILLAMSQQFIDVPGTQMIFI